MILIVPSLNRIKNCLLVCHQLDFGIKDFLYVLIAVVKWYLTLKVYYRSKYYNCVGREIRETRTKSKEDVKPVSRK